MKRASITVLCLLGIAIAGMPSPASAQEDFTVLFDGSNLDAFNPIGDANWGDRRRRRAGRQRQRLPGDEGVLRPTST